MTGLKNLSAGRGKMRLDIRRAVPDTDSRPGKLGHVLQQVLLEAAVKGQLLMNGAAAVPGDNQDKGQQAQKKEGGEDHFFNLCLVF
jgi:hypothetical protein